MNETKKRGNANLPALILLAVLLMFWQAAAMGMSLTELFNLVIAETSK